MREIKQKRTVAAHDHVWVSALDFVVFAGAGCGEKVRGLFRPSVRVVGTKNTEPFPFINDHPELVVPAESFRAFTPAFEGETFVGPCGLVRAGGVVDRLRPRH